MFKPEAMALFGRGFEKAAQLSDGKLIVVGAGHTAVLTDNDKFVTRQVEDWLIQGYYKSWHSVMNDLVDQMITPVALMRLKDSSLALVDMFEELGLGVFHRHVENDTRWYAVCENYRAQINAYLK